MKESSLIVDLVQVVPESLVINVPEKLTKDLFAEPFFDFEVQKIDAGGFLFTVIVESRIDDNDRDNPILLVINHSMFGLRSANANIKIVERDDMLNALLVCSINAVAHNYGMCVSLTYNTPLVNYGIPSGVISAENILKKLESKKILDLFV